MAAAESQYSFILNSMPVSNYQFMSVLLIAVTLCLTVIDGAPSTDLQGKTMTQSRNFIQFGLLILNEIGNPLG